MILKIHLYKFHFQIEMISTTFSILINKICIENILILILNRHLQYQQPYIIIIIMSRCLHGPP